MKTNSEYQKFKPAEDAEKVHETARSSGALEPTPSDIEGPFYKEGAPSRGDQPLSGFVVPNLTIRGSVSDVDGKTIVPATLDVWHADKEGGYDIAGFGYRGKFEVNVYGQYEIKTIIPGDYKISDPGQPDDFRCAHIHFKVSAPGYKILTTQLYFPDDPYNATDHWFDSRRVICHPDGEFQFVLQKV